MPRKAAIVELPNIDEPLEVTLAEKLTLPKVQVGKELWTWVQHQLTVPNMQFSLLKKLGKSTWNTPPEFLMFDYEGGDYILPRGFVGDLVKYLQKTGRDFELKDKRIKLPEIELTSNIELREYQSKALETIQKFHFGVIVAPPGSGKTVLGIELIARYKQPALILVHRKELLDQWIERASSFLGIDKKEIGIIGSGKRKVGEKVTVATIQTLYAMRAELPELAKQFGFVIVDECHHVPANTFSQVIENFNPFYMYGLTATPGRKNKDEKLIFLRIGQIICTINPNSGENFQLRPRTKVNIRRTDLYLPFDYGEDTYELLNRCLIFDSHRNQQIVKDILEEVKNKHSILVLTERKDHVEILNMYLQDKCDTLTVTGDDPKTVRQKKLTQVRAGKFQVLIATGQLMGEGVDISNLNCLFLVYPFSFEGKLVQYIGRIQRTTKEQILYDYHDHRIEFLDKQFKKRQAYYQGI